MKTWRRAQYFLCLGLGVFWTAFCAVATLLAFHRSEAAGHRWHRRWARGLLRLMGVHVEFLDTEAVAKSGAVIFASNHESMWDIPVLAAMPFDFKWISKKEVAKIPLFGAIFRKMGSFFVSRDRSGSDLNVMKEVEDGLRQGKSIVIFPEGTRTRTGALLPFKKGAFRTSQNSGRPLVPVAITGTRLIAPPGELPSGRGHRVVVRFGPPVPVAPHTDLTEGMGIFRRSLERLLAADRARSR